MLAAVVPVPGQHAFVLIVAPDDARVCAACGRACCVVVARYEPVELGSVVPRLTERCLSCDAGEGAA